jgi:thiamine pyrophosphokinase
MQAIVLADGDTATRAALDAAWPGWSEPGAFVVAADGGARHADPLGLAVDLWVGDGDSIEPERLAALAAAGVEIRRVAAAKDESDTELAVLAAVERGADPIVVVGGLGGARFDHTLANVALLAHPALVGRRTVLLDGATRVALIRAPDEDGRPVDRPLPGIVGGLVTLLPFGDGAEGVTTAGLEYPLRDEPLAAGPARGLSNVRVAADASVVVRRGMLLVIETTGTIPA